MTTPTSRLTALRAVMRTHRLAAWLIPSSDPHLSEYLAEHWKGREWFSGFTGSMGTLIVTADFAGLWADSRYWSQAESQLADAGVTLMKLPPGASLQHVDWLAEHLLPGQQAGVDGMVLGLAHARALQAALALRNIALRTDLDIANEVWLDRPALPAGPVYEHRAPFAPLGRPDKLAALRLAMAEHGAQWHLISTLDDLAYLLNLRGADVPHNPVFVGHAIVGPQRTQLFTDARKIAPELHEALRHDGVDVLAYDQVSQALAELPAGGTLLVDPRRITLGLRQSVAHGATVVEAINPTTLAKSRKTGEEAGHIRATMERDAAALAEFFAWFEQAQGRERITELNIDERITAARARQSGFVCPSFSTIAGFNANGALPHYCAAPDSCALIEGNGLLLIDSGGQYEGGTTDVTRVVPVGVPTPEQCRDFTVVLKAMIALSQARFPRGLRSALLDAIARAPLWAEGMDYGHGTGHGVGYFLNVHEGPQSISYHTAPEPHTAMLPGMVTSIEPGLYRPGRWGVRIENLVLTHAAEPTEFGEFLRFETLTLCPIDTRCIVPALLNESERAWLNAYHATVRARVIPHVSGNARQWLLRRTEPFDFDQQSIG